MSLKPHRGRCARCGHDWDADRNLAALRTQHAAPAVVAVEGELPPLPSAQFLGIARNGDAFYGHTDEAMRAYVLADRAALAAQGLGREDTAMREDAERYRWLRALTMGCRDEHGACRFRPPNIEAIGNVMRGSVAQHLDAAIDAARTTPPQKPAGEA